MFSKYFTRLQHYSDIRFITEVAALTIISRYIFVVPVLIILAIMGVDTGTPNMDVYAADGTPLELFFELCIFGPLLETWLLQWLPLKILGFVRIPEIPKIWIVTLVFAFLHLDTGLINFIGTLPIGYLLVWAYVVKQKQSGWRAFWIVFAIHALTNMFPFMIYYLDFLGGV